MTPPEQTAGPPRPRDFPETGRKIAPCPYSPKFFVDEAEAWKSLSVYWFYRLVMAALLVNLFVNQALPGPLQPARPELFALTALVYLTAILLAGIPLILRWPGYLHQAQLQVFADIALLPFLIYASGGITTGMGVLMGMPVAAGGILVGGRCALLFAALATLSVLMEEVVTDVQTVLDPIQYSYSGLLGASFFGIAYLAFQLAQLTERSQAIADQRGRAILNLQQINEYIIQSLEAGILVTDITGTVRLYNAAAATLLPAAEGASLEAISPALSRLFTAWRARPAVQSQLLKADGTPDIHVHFTPLGLTQPPLYLIHLEDSLAQKRRVQLSKLASLGRLTASIAHEIRNPLGAISHASQLLAESPALGGQDLRLIQIILDHSARLNTVVENVLQISRRGEAHRERQALALATARFLEEFEASHGLDPATFRLEIPKTDPQVACDRSHLYQILENLCSNALKYGHPEQGPITLRVAPRSGEACIEVIDHAPPIPPDLADNLFEPFFTTAPNGTGLGLYISRELAELNQARLEYVAEGARPCFRLSFLDLDHRGVP